MARLADGVRCGGHRRAARAPGVGHHRSGLSSQLRTNFSQIAYLHKNGGHRPKQADAAKPEAAPDFNPCGFATTKVGQAPRGVTVADRHVRSPEGAPCRYRPYASPDRSQTRAGSILYAFERFIVCLRTDRDRCTVRRKTDDRVHPRTGLKSDRKPHW